MLKELRISPSNFARVLACPGSAQAEAPYPWTDNKDARHGRVLHDAMALLFTVGEKAWEKIKANPAISADRDIPALEFCYREATFLLPPGDDVKIIIEETLDLAFLGGSTGKADLIFVSPTYKGCIVIDWKFGVTATDDPDANEQMQGYGAGTMYKFKKQGLELLSCETAIFQPFAFKADDRARSHTYSREELLRATERIKLGIVKAKAPAAPRVASPSACHWCKAKNECPQFQAMSGKAQAQKVEAHQQAVDQITLGGDAVTVSPMAPIPMPVVVINSETVARAKALRDLCQDIKVTDENSYRVAGQTSKEARALITLINNNRLSITKPLDDYKKQIMDSAKTATDPLEEGAKALDDQATRYVQDMADKRRAAEAKANAEAEAIERARIAAEDAEAAAILAQAVALKRAQDAEEAAANAKGKAAKEKAAKELAAAQAAQAAADLKAKEEQETKERLERDARFQAAAATAALAEEPKAAGFRTKENAISTIDDVTKVPKKWQAALLIVDQKALDALVKQGKLTEEVGAGWLTIKRKTVAARSR